MMNECRESDSFIVSEKPSNKIRDNKCMAEGDQWNSEFL